MTRPTRKSDSQSVFSRIRFFPPALLLVLILISIPLGTALVRSEAPKAETPSSDAGPGPAPVLSEALRSPEWIGIYEEKRAVNLRWYRVQGAVEYAILRRVDKEESFREIGRAKNPVFTDYLVLPGQLLHYRIVPYDALGVRGPSSEQRYLQMSSQVVKTLEPPTWAASQMRRDGVGLSWSHEAAESVLVYNLYRKGEGERDFGLIFSTKDTAFLDRNVSPGSTYQYVITALNQLLQESVRSQTLKIAYRLPVLDLSAVPSSIRGIRVLEEVISRTDLVQAYSWQDYGFVSPVDVDYWEGEGWLYVSDAGTGQVTVIGKRGEILQRLGGRGGSPWEFDRLLGIAVDGGGYVYAVDAYRADIVIFGPQGGFERRIQLQGLLREYYGEEFNRQYPGRRFGLVDLVVDAGGNLAVTDNPNGRIYILDPQGRLTNVIGAPGGQDGQLHYPTFLQVQGDDSIIVSDTLNSRLQGFSPFGESKGLIGEEGLGIGQFIRPKGIAMDGRGFLYVADSYVNSVQVFSRAGDFVTVLADENGFPLDLGSPNGLVFLEPDQLVICEKLARRVQVRRVLIRQDLPYFIRSGN